MILSHSRWWLHAVRFMLRRTGRGHREVSQAQKTTRKVSLPSPVNSEDHTDGTETARRDRAAPGTLLEVAGDTHGAHHKHGVTDIPQNHFLGLAEGTHRESPKLRLTGVSWAIGLNVRWGGPSQLSARSVAQKNRSVLTRSRDRDGGGATRYEGAVNGLGTDGFVCDMLKPRAAGDCHSP